MQAVVGIDVCRRRIGVVARGIAGDPYFPDIVAGPERRDAKLLAAGRRAARCAVSRRGAPRPPVARWATFFCAERT